MAAGNQNVKSLLDFSLGRCDVHAVMASLGTDSQEDLFSLMAQAHLPSHVYRILQHKTWWTAFSCIRR